MPADDLVLNVRQIAGYTPVGSTAPGDSVLLQRGGLGGPYVSVDANAFARTALEEGGPLGVNQVPPGNAAPGGIYGGHFITDYGGGSGYNAYTATSLTDWRYLLDGPAAALTFGPNAGWEFNVAPFGSAGDPAPMTMMMGLDFAGNLALTGRATLGSDPQGPMDAATAQWTQGLVAALQASVVWSVNGQRGDIFLDVTSVAGAAPIFSPRFQGWPSVPLAEWCDSSSRIASTAWVQRNTVNAIGCLLRDHPFVYTFNGRTGDVVLTPEDITNAGGAEGLAPLDSPAFTGNPTAPTPAPGDNTQSLATTAFVDAAIAGLSDIYAPLASPNFSGTPYAPTAAPGTSTAQLATTAFVQDAVIASTTGVSSFNTRTGAITLDEADITNAGGALTAGPVFTGIPQAPTAAVGNNSNQLATTSWVLTELGGANIGVSSFNGRGGAVILTSADLTSAGGALLNSPGLTGVPTAPTAATNTATDQIATTAFVMAAAAAAGVSSFNGRTGAITLTANDVNAAGALVNPSPQLTGTPTAPTPPPTTNNTTIATTAYVTAALSAGGGVNSFNGRTGAVILSSADVNASAAGGPYASVASLAGRQNRNRIMNGGFLVDQAHGFAAFPWATNSTPYACDRWMGTTNISNNLTSRARAGGNGFQTTGAPAANTMLIAVGLAAAPTATTRAIIYQSLEYGQIADLLWGSANAAPLMLSFWVQASSPATYSGVLRNYGGTRSYPFTFAITAAMTWQFITVAIPGDTAGTWLTGNIQGGAQLIFSLGSGANFTGPAGAWASANFTGANGEFALTSVASATLEFANIQLEAGIAATPFDWKSQVEAQIECQRYLQVPSMTFLVQGYNAAGTTTFGNWTFPVTMRAAPTVTFSNQVYANASGLTAPQVDAYGWRASIVTTALGNSYCNFSASFNADI